MTLKYANIEQPLVSVIIPTYNRMKYLSLAIASATRQTYHNLEIVVSDDGGPEGIHETVCSFDDARIRYRRNPSNVGVSLNTLYAINASQGKYVAILNDDDLWGENFLAELVPHLEVNSNLVIAFSDHYIIDDDGAIDEQATENNTHRWRRHALTLGEHKPFCQIGLVSQSVPMVMSTIIRKSVIDWNDFPSQVGPAYDFWLTYLACRTGLGAYYMPKRLTYYRVHAGAETQVGRIRTSNAHIYCYRRLLQDETLRGLETLFRRRIALAHYTFGVELLRIRRPAEARLHLRTGFDLAPNLRAIIALGLTLLPQTWIRRLWNESL